MKKDSLITLLRMDIVLDRIAEQLLGLFQCRGRCRAQRRPDEERHGRSDGRLPEGREPAREGPADRLSLSSAGDHRPSGPA